MKITDSRRKHTLSHYCSWLTRFYPLLPANQPADSRSRHSSIESNSDDSTQPSSGSLLRHVPFPRLFKGRSSGTGYSLIKLLFFLLFQRDTFDRHTSFIQFIDRFEDNTEATPTQESDVLVFESISRNQPSHCLHQPLEKEFLPRLKGRCGWLFNLMVLRCRWWRDIDANTGVRRRR